MEVGELFTEPAPLRGAGPTRDAISIGSLLSGLTRGGGGGGSSTGQSVAMARPRTCGARGRSRGARRPCGRGRDGRRGGGRARRRTGAFACRGTSRASTARSASLASSLARKVARGVAQRGIARGVALGKRPAPRRPPPRARALGLQLVGARGHALLGDTARGDTARGDMERTAREKKKTGHTARGETRRRRAVGRWADARGCERAAGSGSCASACLRACAHEQREGKERRGKGDHYFVCDKKMMATAAH